MIPKGLFTQIALLIIGVGIVITYIQPTFSEISATQDQIATYAEERSKVQEFNDTLSNRLDLIDSVFSSDLDRLRTYMPDSVDTIAVMRDIEDIAEDAGVVIGGITDGGPLDRDRAGQEIYADTAATQSVAGPYAYNFTASVRGSYGQIKDMLDRLGRNHYPLEVRALDMRTEEGGFITADIEMFTYSNMPMSSETDLFSDVNVIYE
jgi:hypothetical protein